MIQLLLNKRSDVSWVTKTSLKDFDYRPTGIVTNSDGSNAVYYQNTKVIGLESRLVRRVFLRLGKHIH